MVAKFEIQVPKEHYYNNYDNVTRFISYYYQVILVQELLKYKEDNVLEIGIGNKTTYNYLKQQGINIDGCDFDKDLGPDYVGDIRNLPFNNNSYKVILASEVLEHITWGDVYIALRELHRVSNRYVIISIPYSSAGFELVVKFPLINRLIGKKYLSMFARVPYFFLPYNFNGEHYWEMGRKNYSIRRVRETFNQYFNIIKEVRPMLNDYHYYFVLEKIQPKDINI